MNTDLCSHQFVKEGAEEDMKIRLLCFRYCGFFID